MNETLTVPPNERAKLGELLLHISDDVLRAVNETLQRHGISESRFALLLRLHENVGRCQPSELAQRLGIRRASVTKQLVLLEQQNIIKRNANLTDGRAVDVTITAKGYDILREALPDYWKTCAALVEKLNDEEILQAIRLLVKTEI